MTQASQWAIVELFGHARIAGRISEQEFGGTKMVRVDVPAVSADPKDPDGEKIDAHTRFFGGGAIYSINWVDELVARIAAGSIRHQPIDTWSLQSALARMSDADRQRLLAAPAGQCTSFDVDDDPDDRDGV